MKSLQPLSFEKAALVWQEIQLLEQSQVGLGPHDAHDVQIPLDVPPSALERAVCSCSAAETAKPARND